MVLHILNYSSLFELLRTLIYYLCNLARHCRRTPESIPEEELPPLLCEELVEEEEELELHPLLLEELVEDILSWLPVKSLLRFRSVSKSWNSLISDSRFVKLHLHHSSSRVHADFSHARFLTTCYFPDPRPYISYQPYISYRSVTSLFESDHSAKSTDCFSDYILVGACNGLVCLRNVCEWRGCLFCRCCFWNPATRSMSQHSPHLKSYDYWGFGYDSSSDTYKVVNLSPEETMVNVYNMGDDRWWRIQVSPLPGLRLKPPAYYVSNNINWLATPHIFFEKNGTDLYKIVSFDLGKQKYAQLSLPYSFQPRNEFIYGMPILGVLRGCLCISENNTKACNFAVWQMKEFGVHQSWTKLFSLNGLEHWPYSAMCMSDNGDALVLSVSATFRGVLYTFRDNKLEGTKIANEINGCYAENYIDSLVSPC